MPDWLIGIAVTVAFVGLFILADRVPSFFRYTVDDTGVRVRLFGLITLASVPFGEIAEVRVESWRNLLLDGALSTSVRIGVSMSRKPVVIWRKTRGPLIIAPTDTESFIASVNRQLEAVRTGRLTSA